MGTYHIALTVTSEYLLRTRKLHDLSQFMGLVESRIFVSFTNGHSLLTLLRRWRKSFCTCRRKHKAAIAMTSFQSWGKKIVLTSLGSIPWFVGHFLPLFENAKILWVLLASANLFSLLYGTTVTCSGCSGKAQQCRSYPGKMAFLWPVRWPECDDSPEMNWVTFQVMIMCIAKLFSSMNLYCIFISHVTMLFRG